MSVPPFVARQARRRPPAVLTLAALAIALEVLSATAARAAGPNALWEIVHGQCVPHQQQRDDPKPCVMVALHDGAERGYAILKDLVGATQFLLIPTAPISGIESPELLAPDVPNYFAAAWRARTYVDSRARRTLPREGISLAINSKLGRSQAQLHIHIDCIRMDVRDTLREHAAQIGERWAPLDAPLVGRRYLAMRVLGQDLGQANPFKLLADGVPGAREEMERHTLVVAGATFAGGEPGFVILDNRADPDAGDWGHGEDLQDHACALMNGSTVESSSR